MPLAICATPIGNLEDVTLRVLAELREADVVLAEDTRHTRVLLRRHGIEARLLSYHEHNEGRSRRRVAAEADRGRADRARHGRRAAGRLRSRRAARASGARRRRARDRPAGAVGRRDGARRQRARVGAVRVRRLPAAARRRAVGSLGELGSWRWPVVAFESPRRLPASLGSLAAVFPERDVVVCRELTKQFEEVVRGTAAELAERFATPPKGEITLVLRARRAWAGRGGRGVGRGARNGRSGRRRHAAPGGRRGRLAPDGHGSKRPLPRLFVTSP